MNNCFKITDERFSAERTDLYDLIFEIQFSRFRFMVCSGSQLLWLEDHFLGNSNDLQACMARYSAILEQHPVLGIPYWKSIRLISGFQIHTLIPAEVFETSRAAEYLQLVYPSARLADFEVTSEAVLNQHMVSATISKINRIFRERYPTLTVLSGITTGMRYFARLSPDITLGVMADRFIDLYYRNTKSKLTIAEKIPLKYLDELSGSTLTLMGEVTPFSASFALLKERFQTVMIGNYVLPEEPAGKFADLPGHRYFTLWESRPAAD